jgi:hypothetical protein
MQYTKIIIKNKNEKKTTVFMLMQIDYIIREKKGLRK